MKRGRPSNPSGDQPSRAWYKCPVDTCESEQIRGDDITRHFQKFANLKIVDDATENLTNLRKNNEANDVIVMSEEYLKNLLKETSNKERLHTIYLFENGHTSTQLPNFNSLNFKCQQKKAPIPHFFLPKKTKSDDRDISPQPSTSTESTSLSLEPKSSEVSETMDLNESQKSEKDEFKSNIETVEQEITLTQPDTELHSLNTSSNVPKEKSFDSFLTEDLMDRFANKVAVTTRVQVLQALQKKETQKETEYYKEKYWMDSENYLICNPCLVHSTSISVPKQLLSGKRGNFGYVEKGGKGYLVEAVKSRHCDKPLHIWCVKEFEKKEEKRIQQFRRNELAGKKIIRNALLCFKRSLGCEDFLALNEIHFLAERDLGNVSFNIATKNDSRLEYFRLRREIYEIVSNKTKKFFEEIQDIAVTLDKVTVQRNSFTVIMTYFFSEGKIHIILNELKKLSTKDYDGKGTATMVIKSLCDTLGYTKSKLSQVLKHFVYDGVYANSEERTSGGGSLELRKYVEKELNLEPNSITGN